MRDKEVEKKIRFWQREKQCVIVLAHVNEDVIMSVLFIKDGSIETDIRLGSVNDFKERILINMSKYFREVRR